MPCHRLQMAALEAEEAARSKKGGKKAVEEGAADGAAQGAQQEGEGAAQAPAADAQQGDEGAAKEEGQQQQQKPVVRWWRCAGCGYVEPAHNTAGACAAPGAPCNWGTL